VLDMAGIDDAIVPHKPFHGVSLRPALEDSVALFERPEVFRMTVWGNGMVTAPKGFVPDPPALRFEDHHMALRGAEYKLHARPGGKVELYDILDDAVETTDVSKRFPEVTKRMLAECRRRWSHAIDEGKAFRMAKIVVGDPSTWKYGDGTFWGYATKVQDVAGTPRVGRGLHGFAKPQDRASYRLEVTKAGNYRISLTGQGLHAAAHLQVRLAGQILKPRKTADTRIAFGSVALPRGEMELEIATGKPDGETKPVFLERILFSFRD